jgi:hypothetical protein
MSVSDGAVKIEQDLDGADPAKGVDFFAPPRAYGRSSPTEVRTVCAE